MCSYNSSIATASWGRGSMTGRPVTFELVLQQLCRELPVRTRGHGPHVTPPGNNSCPGPGRRPQSSSNPTQSKPQYCSKCRLAPRGRAIYIGRGSCELVPLRINLVQPRSQTSISDLGTRLANLAVDKYNPNHR